MNVTIHIKNTVYALLSCIFLLTAAGCSDDDRDPGAGSDIFIHNALLPSFLKVYTGQNIVIQGKGFEAGDALIFDDGRGNEYRLPVTATDRSAAFVIPDGMEQSDYQVYAAREEVTQQLGSILLLVTRNVDIPDRDGATIKGYVYSGDSAMEGVLVSDGVEFTTTDADGFYWLNSRKEYGYVFIVIPSGYEVTTVNAIPYFWSTLMSYATDGTEQHNFELVPVDNDDHIMVTLTDLHLANVNDDLDQFGRVFMPDLREHLATLGDRKIYSMFLGDMSWDYYWYINNYSITEYKNRISDFPLPVFHVMGNHDNDPLFSNDFAAEERYRRDLGPTFYAFDLGRVHYIVLDNIVYKENREYDRRISADQMSWLTRYLDTIEDKTEPVVIGIHIQVFNRTGTAANAITTYTTNATELEALLAPFSNVHILSGHTHKNFTVERSANLMEHNQGAVCATWWKSGFYSGNQICPDGSYAGYGVYTFTGKDLEWYYKSTGFGKEKQFRTYDMNRVKTYMTTDTDVQKFYKLAPSRQRYTSFPANSVMLNVFNYDSRWTIEVTEDGNPLPSSSIVPVMIEDPLSMISSDVPSSIAAKKENNESSSTVVHIFRIDTSSPVSTLEIKVTDRFGNVYTETMTRPKAFSVHAD